ncbi:DUF6210 family protein [Myxococcus sp. AM009]|uniref:DUF6210 family protein n=1 Tax=Myxococcus sp. AM009 TaxID=2745137 RepID=UPI0034D2C958
MSTSLVIQLYDSAGLGLILLWPTGVLYSNQTGGNSCLHPQAEGAYLPLVDELVDLEGLLHQFFVGPQWMGRCDRGLDEETAREIERILGLSYTTRELGLRVDRARLEDSHEAWVYVEVPAQPGGDLALLGPIPTSRGILTWANSD